MDEPSSRRRPTVEDLVRVSGVSRSSVFRYLGGKSLRPAIKEAIETAMRRLGYPLAGTEAARPFELLISISTNYGSFPGYGEVVEGIMARAGELGVHVRLVGGQAARAEGLDWLPPAVEGRPRGVVILGKTIQEEEAEAALLASRGIPLVLINRMIDAPGISYVSADFVAAAAEAVGHLLDSGRRRIALWEDNVRISRVQGQKVEGYRRAYTVRNLPLPEGIYANRDTEDLETAARRLLEGPQRPDAWFAMDDQAAMRVIRLAHDLGLKVPGDLAVVGMNDIEASSLARPSISSVKIPFFDAGWTAVDVLARLISRPMETAIRVILAHGLVTRESSQGGRKEKEK